MRFKPVTRKSQRSVSLAPPRRESIASDDRSTTGSPGGWDENGRARGPNGRLKTGTHRQS